MTRPSNEDGNNGASWWNSRDKEELERLEFLQKEMMAAMKKPSMGPDEEDEDMGPPDLPEDDEDMGPPDLPEDDDMDMAEDDEMALEPTPREMDMQDRMNNRRARVERRPNMRNRAQRRMKSGAPRDITSKSLRAEMELKRAFSQTKRMDLAKQGMALPDGSFPIVTTTDLKNAIMAFGRAKNKTAAKRHIIKRAQALKRSDLIPNNWGKKDAKGDGYMMCQKTGKMIPGGSKVCPECKGNCGMMGTKGLYGASMEMPKKKKKIRYGEKEADMAEMEDNEMTSPMSREELMERIFKKKKKKPGMHKMPDGTMMSDDDMPAEDEEM